MKSEKKSLVKDSRDSEHHRQDKNYEDSRKNSK